MKTRIVIFCVVLFAFVPLAYAKPDKDDKKYTDEKVATVEKTISGHETRIQELEAKVSNLTAQLEALDKWGKEKWGIGVEELEKANRKAEKGIRKGSYSLWLLIPVTAIILAVVGFAFWPRKVIVPHLPPDSSDHPKCPRCGWEHDPADTICKNPKCKTQF